MTADASKESLGGNGLVGVFAASRVRRTLRLGGLGGFDAFARCR